MPSASLILRRLGEFQECEAPVAESVDQYAVATVRLTLIESLSHLRIRHSKPLIRRRAKWVVVTFCKILADPALQVDQLLQPHKAAILSFAIHPTQPRYIITSSMDSTCVQKQIPLPFSPAHDDLMNSQGNSHRSHHSRPATNLSTCQIRRSLRILSEWTMACNCIVRQDNYPLRRLTMGLPFWRGRGCRGGG